jgi:AraC-like DNA-binding protein
MHATAHHWRPDFRYRLEDLFAPGFGRNIGSMQRLDYQPYPPGLGVRFAAPAPRQGYTDVVRVSEEMHVLTINWVATENSRICSVWEEMLDPGWGWLYFRIEGESENDVNSTQPITLGSPSVSLSVLPPNSAQRWRDDTSVDRRGISIAFRPSAVTSRLGELLADCPAPLRHWVTHGTTAYHTSDIPMQPIMNTATRSLFDLPLEGQIRYRFVCSTAEQLMCLALAALARRTGEGVLPMQLSAKDRKSLENVRCVLDEKLLDPPGTAQLARLAGMNRNKLLYGFKHLFGKTISEYIHERRMQRAHELLDSNSMTVTDVAASVGYAHVSNFTTAFKRHFGCSPSRLHAPAAHRPHNE